MARRSIGIVMNGVTGRMGYRQHLVRSILALREQGGLTLADGTVLWPEPVLVGRNADKLEALAERHQRATLDHRPGRGAGRPGKRDLLRRPAHPAARGRRQAGDRPRASTSTWKNRPPPRCRRRLELARLADTAGLKHGVVQDKLFLPGLIKLKRLVDGGFFGRILSVRGEFGYWVFEGGWQPAQRPSWNYRAADGGGIVLDMFPHWQYVLEHSSRRSARSTRTRSRTCRSGGTSRASRTGPRRRRGLRRIRARRRHRRADQLVLGSPGAPGRTGRVPDRRHPRQRGGWAAGVPFQHRAGTPKPVWNPDIPNTEPFREQWQSVPDNGEFDNGFKVQWELFLDHVVRGARSSRMTCGPGRRACSWPSWAWPRPARAAGSRCRSWGGNAAVVAGAAAG